MHQKGLLWPIEDSFVRARFIVVFQTSLYAWSLLVSEGTPFKAMEKKITFASATRTNSDESLSVQYARSCADNKQTSGSFAVPLAK